MILFFFFFFLFFLFFFRHYRAEILPIILFPTLSNQSNKWACFSLASCYVNNLIHFLTFLRHTIWTDSIWLLYVSGLLLWVPKDKLLLLPLWRQHIEVNWVQSLSTYTETFIHWFYVSARVISRNWGFLQNWFIV